MNEIQKLSDEIKKELKSVKDLLSLDKIKLQYLGRKGHVSQLTKKLPELPDQERRQFGAAINALKQEIQVLFDTKQQDLTQKKDKRIQQHPGKSQKSVFDMTLPPYPAQLTKPHPLTQTMYEITDIFVSLGFDIALGSEIETEYYNFEALNIPKFHPARDMQDTFYLKNETLLRTHTSPGQVHIMEKYKPPVRIIIPGKVYRHDAVDVTHSFMFHQVEGLAVDTDITFADLKGILAEFAKRMFHPDIKTFFRPSYFPFTEPSAEMDIECIMCRGKGCKVCKNSGWIEILGCGMVNPKVFDYVKYDRTKYTGFAFGIGIERVAMLKYRIDDMRILFENDIRFLTQL
jgi:phenylalanyl-tRNA synthetase alpha chain